MTAAEEITSRMSTEIAETMVWWGRFLPKGPCGGGFYPKVPQVL